MTDPMNPAEIVEMITIYRRKNDGTVLGSFYQATADTLEAISAQLAAMTEAHAAAEVQMIAPNYRDNMAKALREYQMQGRITNDWGKVPKGQKKKWFDLADAAIAALTEGTPT